MVTVTTMHTNFYDIFSVNVEITVKTHPGSPTPATISGNGYLKLLCLLPHKVSVLNCKWVSMDNITINTLQVIMDTCLSSQSLALY